VSVICVHNSGTANLPVLFLLQGAPLQLTGHVCLSHSRPTIVVAVHTKHAMADMTGALPDNKTSPLGCSGIGICVLLQAAGMVLRKEDYTVRVPRSQRGGEIVEPLIREQWFVRMQPLAEPALQVALQTPPPPPPRPRHHFRPTLLCIGVQLKLQWLLQRSMTCCGCC